MVELLYSHTAVANSVWGTVQVKPPSESTWTTCTWSVDSANIGAFSRMYVAGLATFGGGGTFTMSSGMHPLTRAGFQVESGCKLKSSWFLPDNLVVRDRAVVELAGSILWYQGAITDSDQTTYQMSRSSTCSYSLFEEIKTFSIDSMSSGDVFTAR